MSTRDEFWKENGEFEEVWNRWLALKKYKELLSFIIDENDVGYYSKEAYSSYEKALLENNEVYLFKQFWKHIIGTKVKRFWNFYKSYLSYNDTPRLKPDEFPRIEKKLVEENRKKKPAFQDEHLNIVYHWQDLQWHINEYTERLHELGDTAEITKMKLLKESIYHLNKPKAKRTSDKRKIDESLFWELIQEIKIISDDKIDFSNRLQSKLESFKAEEIKRYEKTFLQKLNDLHQADIWALAFIVRNGCGDDCFDYFKAWIIAQGESVFNAVKNMKIFELKSVFTEEDPQFEEFMYVAQEAYENKKGETMPKPRIKQTPLRGDMWEEAELPKRYPEVFKLKNGILKL